MSSSINNNQQQSLLSSPQTSSSSSSKMQTIVCDSFQKTMMDNLFRFKNDNLFTDICIYVEGVEFKCHKVILCAVSSYFKAMFSCDLKESRLGKVYIENISPWTMKRLLDFFYTAKIDINDDNVIDIFNAAIMFNLYSLVEKCTIYIEEHIDINNCIDLNLFADLYNIEKLKNATFNFILENFMLIYELNDDYKKLSENTFISLIKSDYLNVSNEIYVYNAIKNWYQHLPKQRTQHLNTLFQLIRFDSINNEDLINLVNTDPLLKENNFNVNICDNKQNTRPSTLPRDYLCFLNHNLFQIYDFYKSKWVIMDNNWPPNTNQTANASINSNKLNGFSICVINNVMYLNGGLNCDTKKLVNTMWKYDSIKNIWSTCMPMLTQRAYHLSLHLTSQCDTKTNDELVNYIFVFYGICNKQLANSDHQLEVISNENDVKTHYEQCKQIEFYNTSTDCWSILILNNSIAANYHLFQVNSQFDIIRYIQQRDQLMLRKSIISLKNILYILQGNSIHCYEFSPKQSQFLCLPYFRLPDNLSNNFILLKAISIQTSSSACLSMFTWLLPDSEESGQQLAEHHQQQQQQQSSDLNLIKYETLIYLLNPHEKLIYEFYPAKNKLKKLPDLLLKHSINDTYMININSNIYLTGGIIESSNDSDKYSAIEKFDSEKNTWSIFMDTIDNLNNQISNYDDNFRSNNNINEQNAFIFPFTNIFFKLKMSI